MHISKTYLLALLASVIAPGILAKLESVDVPYTPIQPILHRFSPTAENGVAAAQDPFPDHIQITVDTPKRPLLLDLHKAKNLFSTDYSHEMIRMASDGSVVRTHSRALPTADCFYQGKVVGDEKSVASVDFCTNSMTGYISTSEGSFTIENENSLRLKKSEQVAQSDKSEKKPVDPSIWDEDGDGFIDPDTEVIRTQLHSIEAAMEAPHFIVDSTIEEDLLKDTGVTTSCGVFDADNSDEGYYTSENSKEHPHELLASSDVETSSEVTEVNTSAARTKPKKYVELLVFNDNARYRSLGSGTSMATLQLINDIASYYRNGNFQYDVEIVLKGQITFTEEDPYTVPYRADGAVITQGNEGLLNVFNWYRATYINHLPAHDLGMLLSSLNFEDSIRGLATVGSICMHPSVTGSINQVTFRSRVMNAVTAAHELGHNLGSQHDVGRGYIMQPYVGTDTQFSAQSKNSIEYNMSTRSCMDNNPFQAVRENEFGRFSAEIPVNSSSNTRSHASSGFSIFGLERTQSILAVSGISLVCLIVALGGLARMIQVCKHRNELQKQLSKAQFEHQQLQEQQSRHANAHSDRSSRDSSARGQVYVAQSNPDDQSTDGSSGFDIESPRIHHHNRNRSHHQSIYSYNLPEISSPSMESTPTPVTKAPKKVEAPYSPHILPSPSTVPLRQLNQGEVVNLTLASQQRKKQQREMKRPAPIHE